MRRLWKSRVLRTLLAAGLAALIAPAAAQARLAAQPLDPARLGRAAVVVRDRVIGPGRATARGLEVAKPRLPAGGLDVRLPVGDGHTVRVVLSDVYQPDMGVAQSVAAFLATLIHGGEIDGVTVFLATAEEIRLVCGEGAEACFNSMNNTMLVPGSTPASGIPREDIFAHEYGHAVANGRSNFPFPAVGSGTKRWATYEHVCQRLLGALTTPGGGIAYRDDPGEAFADSYRILNGGNPALFIFNRAFFPNPTDLSLIRRDVLDPWAQRLPYLLLGSFPASRPSVSTRRISIVTPLDGVLKVTVQAPPGGDEDLELYVGGVRHAVAKGARRGRADQVSALICGARSFRLVVRRHGGFGRYRLRVTRP